MFFLLEDSLIHLPGIGPHLTQKFARLGVANIADLIHYYPRKWEDFSQIIPINKTAEAQKVTLRATLANISQFRPRGRHLHIIKAIFRDATGNLLITWFNQPYLTKTLKKGIIYFISGVVRSYQNQLTLVNPSIEPADTIPLHSGRIIPIYPVTEGITSKRIRRSLKYLIATIRSLSETLPPKILNRYQLIGRAQALENIHFPASAELLIQARARLSFEELLMVQLGLAIAKRHWDQLPGTAISAPGSFLSTFSAKLDFELTAGQQQALAEIINDLAQAHPMRRLLLGDVGSGKTAIAAGAIVAAVKAGFQAALMAPTEVLATQHYHNLSPLMKRFGIKTTLMTGSSKLSDSSEISEGSVDLIVGTHALIQQQITFKNLNLVVVDEQHRFGVRQRQKLKNKMPHTTPHFLSLSATPIPRTLFLGLLNDLDISVLTDLPQGRVPTITRLITPKNFNEIQQLIEKEIHQKHPIFVITPLIDEESVSPSPTDLKPTRASIYSEAKNLARLFPSAKIGTLHGRMDTKQKLKVMDDLLNGKLDIVIATSIIEVGIDVPKATVIWIKNAERFGLAQLHQLRGRVGRSNLQSYCLIETGLNDLENLDRLTAFVNTNDGAKLAELDLKLRGPGSFFSDQQSGFLKLRLADLTDKKLIQTTQRAAHDLLDDDPKLDNYPNVKAQLHLNYLTHEE